MSLQAGLVGLPNVGKSTLFNALLQKEVADAQNYPFCTVDPNVGVVEVCDNRLSLLADAVGTKTTVPAAIEFVDIAGLVENAHQGEGLGNQFLSHIREVDLIIFVLRDFSDPNVARVGSVNPKKDLETLATELGLADLQILEKQKPPRGKVSKQDTQRWQAIQKVKNHLTNSPTSQRPKLSTQEKKVLKSFGLLTIKPMIVVVNIDEQKLTRTTNQIANLPTLYISARLELELSKLPESEVKDFLKLYNLPQPVLDRLIHTTYQTLGLISFFTTTGGKEVRAWPIPQGTSARKAAEKIHSDFAENFIKARVVNYQQFIEQSSWKNLKEAGMIEVVGQDYKVREGDVVEFVI